MNAEPFLQLDRVIHEKGRLAILSLVIFFVLGMLLLVAGALGALQAKEAVDGLVAAIALRVFAGWLPDRIGLKRVLIAGVGDLGRLVADRILDLPVHLYDAMPSVGRKFLLAGIGGLNLTHAEPFDRFAQRYGARNAEVGALVNAGAGTWECTPLAAPSAHAISRQRSAWRTSRARQIIAEALSGVDMALWDLKAKAAGKERKRK